LKIYTKQGDKGTTAVYTSTLERYQKDHEILECYGTLDELNAYLGLIVSQLDDTDTSQSALSLRLQDCQKQLFTIGFAVSDNDKLSNDSIELLESHIDEMQSKLPAQTTFILPGGCVLASHLHVARTVARRAERSVVRLSKQQQINPLALSYLNRLSDYLFVLARYANAQANVADIPV
jgi:cob(I)alamin adenosyltransferase